MSAVDQNYSINVKTYPSQKAETTKEVEVIFFLSEIFGRYIIHPEDFTRPPYVLPTFQPPLKTSTVHIPSDDDQESVRRNTLEALNIWTDIPEVTREEIVKRVNSEFEKMALVERTVPGLGLMVVAFIECVTERFWDYTEFTEAVEQAESQSMEDNGPVPATKSSIEALELEVFDNVDSSLKKDCIICMDEIEVGVEAIRMPCSHIYHQDCIVKWLQNSHVCPLCRYEMPT